MIRMGKGTNTGFSLIEMLAVVSLVVLLASLVAGLFGYARAKSIRSRTVKDLEILRNTLEEYRMEHGGYIEHSGILSNAVESRVLTNYAGEVRFEDPWGNGYEYSSSSRYVYRLWSRGRDASDTAEEDDIETVGR